MHMADALISPAVGCTLWGLSAGIIAYSSRKVSRSVDDKRVPLMGALGAFVFAAQMINFTIPATGSSGHLGGGLLLAILLGPWAAFLTIASVLTVQAFFFGDGGLLALGGNIFNLGFFPAFIAYPLVYRVIAGPSSTRARITAGAVAGGITALQLGSLGVVLETAISGISAIPFSSFILLMQPIHLCIGIIEGIITAAVVSFVYQARPEILNATALSQPSSYLPVKRLATTFALLAFITAGLISWTASERPDGLEWSIERLAGHRLETPQQGLSAALASLQKRTAFLPDYNLKKPDDSNNRGLLTATATLGQGGGQSSRFGTSLAGVVGATMTLLFSGFTALILRRMARAN